MPAAIRTRAEIEQRIRALTEDIQSYQAQGFLADAEEAARRRDCLLDEWALAR